jgi:hypothetical protein
LYHTLKDHETSKHHLEAHKNWIELSDRLKSNTTIDERNQDLLNAEIRHWQAVLERLVTIIRFLGQQCLALRGSSDILHEENNGNYSKLVERFAKFDSVMAEHLRRIRDKDTHVHYLGKDIQNQLIQIISEAVREEILENLKNAKYYSIIVDCTPDISKVEQMSVVVRFVQIKDGEELRIQGHFLDLPPVEQTSGEELTKAILQELRKHNIPLENMRGQA